MFEMAKRGFSGRRITIEMDKARWTWCRKAADAGHARAAELYAGMAPVMEGISHKKGMERKCIELIDQWMLQAADLGSWRAMKTLGKQHYFGSKYTKRDQKKGIAYFQKLIEVLGCDEPIRSIEDEMEVKILSPDGRVLPAPRPKRWKG
jgi:hypothetical protein